MCLEEDEAWDGCQNSPFVIGQQGVTFRSGRTFMLEPGDLNGWVWVIGTRVWFDLEPRGCVVLARVDQKRFLHTMVLTKPWAVWAHHVCPTFGTNLVIWGSRDSSSRNACLVRRYIGVSVGAKTIISPSGTARARATTRARAMNQWFAEVYSRFPCTSWNTRSCRLLLRTTATWDALRTTWKTVF